MSLYKDKNGAVVEHQVDDGGDALGDGLEEVLHLLLILVERLALHLHQYKINLAWHLPGVPINRPDVRWSNAGKGGKWRDTQPGREASGETRRWDKRAPQG